MQAMYSKSAALYEAIQGHPDCTPELAAKVVTGRDLRADWESMYVAAGALFKRRFLRFWLSCTMLIRMLEWRGPVR
jgi:hypothetical protein